MMNVAKILPLVKRVSRVLLVGGSGTALATATIDQYIALLSGLTALVGAVGELAVRIIDKYVEAKKALAEIE